MIATFRFPAEEVESDDVLVISADGKGIVMRPDALREATAKKAADASTKLTSRLSKGEKANRKRMATVGAVYDATPAVRTPADIIVTVAGCDGDRQPTAGPVADNKWLTVSVVDDAATVVATLFDEADRRDPHHRRAWIALVDGNNHQIDRINTEAAARGVQVTVVVDFVHVIEYLWSAAWSFHDEGDPAAEAWVADKSHQSARRTGTAGRRHHPTHRHPPRPGPTPAGQRRPGRQLPDQQGRLPRLPDRARVRLADRHRRDRRACRHLVKDRMDLTGARWALPGAEAVLQLRALRTNGDFDNYWHFHLAAEHHRVHQTRYANNVIQQAT